MQILFIFFSEQGRFLIHSGRNKYQTRRLDNKKISFFMRLRLSGKSKRLPPAEKRLSTIQKNEIIHTFANIV